MPPVRHNFCRDGHGWAKALMLRGAPLHFLCHGKWHGTCTANGDHCSACGTFFHNRHFRLPVEHHADALAVFLGQEERTSAAELAEYGGRLVLGYTLDEIAGAASALSCVARHVREALELVESVSCSVRSARVLSEAGMLPARHVPGAEAAAKMAPGDDALWLCQHHDWKHRGLRVSRRLHKRICAAVRGVLLHYRVPAEVGELIEAHLYTDMR